MITCPASLLVWALAGLPAIVSWPDGLYYLYHGNTEFVAGRLPEAILAYRQAERFIPNDARLKANLADARSRVLDPPAVPRSWGPDGLPRLSRLAQGRGGLALDALGWTVLTFWLFYRWRRLLVAGVVLVLAGLALAASAAWNDSWDRRYPVAVIAADGVVFRKGNGYSYPALEINSAPVRLNRGVEARLRCERPNGWVQLELADGRLGWVPRPQALVDHSLTGADSRAGGPP